MAIKFDLSDVQIPADATITEAVLSLYSYDDVGYGANGNKDIHRITSDWQENTITWSNQPSYSNTALSSHNSSTTMTWNEFDVTSAIEDILQNNGDNYGFYVIFPSRDYGVRIRSSEYSDVTYRPKLTIAYELPNPTIIVQNGGEEWEQYSTQTIQWFDNITGTVKIDLVENGTVFETIASDVPSNGTYEWLIPEDFQTGEYTIVVTSNDDPSVMDESDEPVTIVEERLLSLPYTQSFDAWSETKDMEYWEQSTDDDLDWTIQEGPTPSRIGSSPDMTGAEADRSGTGKYIYLEASDPNFPDKKASIITPKFDFRSFANPQLTVWYHMYSQNNSMGDFFIDIKVDDNDWDEGILTLSGDQGDMWQSITIDLASYANNNKRVRFRLRGITGSDWCSDICIDDFIIDAATQVRGHLQSIPSSYDLKVCNRHILFQVPDRRENGRVRITLYTLQGKEIKTLVNDTYPAGYYTVPIHGLADGLYMSRMETEHGTKTVTGILTK